MKKTSRRTFGKQLAGALAALPTAALVTSTVGQPRKGRQRREEIKNHENTPPPIDIQDGSFTIKAKTRTANHPLAETGSGPFTYRGKIFPTNGENAIEHIRVFRGNGDRFYRDGSAEGSVVTIQLKDENDVLVDTLVFSSVVINGDDFLQIVSNTQMAPSSRPGRKHRHFLEHRGGAGNRDFRITSIRITKGGSTRLNHTLPPVSADHPFEPQGLRVLIWLGHD